FVPLSLPWHGRPGRDSRPQIGFVPPNRAHRSNWLRSSHLTWHGRPGRDSKLRIGFVPTTVFQIGFVPHSTWRGRLGRASSLQIGFVPHRPQPPPCPFQGRMTQTARNPTPRAQRLTTRSGFIIIPIKKTGQTGKHAPPKDSVSAHLPRPLLRPPTHPVHRPT